MKKKRKYLFLIFVLVVIISIIFILKNKSNSNSEDTTESTSETEVIKTDILNTVSNSSYVVSGLEENKELHTTYYFEEIYFEKNQYISAGENILKYTNGTYLVAPYNCVITALSIPNSGEICTNKHYITLQSTDTLQISLNVDESELDTIYIGQEARIEVDVLSNNVITGYVTNISNTATYSSSGSTFKATVEFQNDENNVLLGMSAKCSIVLEKAENAIAVAKEAVKEKSGSKYVTVKLNNGETKDVTIETGIENDAYVEVKSGLNEGDIVLIEESTSKQTTNMQDRMTQKMERKNMSGTLQGGTSEEKHTMPIGD